MDDFTVARNPCISGNVFYDTTPDNTVNGTGINSIGGNQLYVVVVNGSGNIVASSAVGAGGTYNFSNVYPGNYTMRLTTTVPGAVGTPAPAATLAPTTWAFTGEHIGLGIGDDGTTDGKIAVSPAAGNRLTGAAPILTGSTTVTYVDFGVNTVPLPVKLVHFSANRQGDSVQINWTTASEINNQYFVVEKSSDGINWIQLHIVPTQGNGFSLQYYNDVDHNPFPGKSFYRLKQVDIDGRFSYSGIVMVEMPQYELKNNLLISPNPVSGSTATINFLTGEDAGNSQLTIIDDNGRLMKNYSWMLQKGTNKITLTDLNDLPHGTYYVLLRNKNGEKISHSIFVK